tara:strand:- start:3361 stop:4389 length:1029 start_codon:yes stop_codon:yes gene_type:complete
MKKAVILFNLGGPDKLDSVEPFLFNLFKDPAIIDLPKIFRYPIAKLISNRRAPVAKKIYEQLGGSSPILKLTEEQSAKLEKMLNLSQSQNQFKTFIVMRCWHPRAIETIQKLKLFEPDEVILLPLYPQYSASTTGSSIKEWHQVCNSENFHVKTSTICCYPTDDYFINAHVNLIEEKIKNLKNFKLIFSAHGLPERNIKKGDPYQWQVEQTVDKIVKKMNIVELNYILSYQSRVGPLKWIGPSTDSVIIENSKLGKDLVIVPIAFVSEHSETLVELDIEYKKLADENGCKNYIRVQALGIDENFIKSMNNLILNIEEYKFKNGLYSPKNKCPSNFIKCPCLN